MPTTYPSGSIGRSKRSTTTSRLRFWLAENTGASLSSSPSWSTRASAEDVPLDVDALEAGGDWTRHHSAVFGRASMPTDGPWQRGQVVTPLRRPIGLILST